MFIIYLPIIKPYSRKLNDGGDDHVRDYDDRGEDHGGDRDVQMDSHDGHDHGEVQYDDRDDDDQCGREDEEEYDLKVIKSDCRVLYTWVSWDTMSSRAGVVDVIRIHV